MRFNFTCPRSLRLLSLSCLLAMSILCGSFVTLANFSVKSRSLPILPRLAVAKAAAIPTPQTIPAAKLAVSNSDPLASVFIQAIPQSEAIEITLHQINQPVDDLEVGIDYVDPDTGGTSHGCAHTGPISSTDNITATASIPIPLNLRERDLPDNSLVISATVNNQSFNLLPINLNLTYVETMEGAVEIAVDDLNVKILNSNTFSEDVYLLAMSTHSIPADLPLGHEIVGRPYQANVSGIYTQSNRFMTLELSYQQPLPNLSDVHTLTFLYWDQGRQTWTMVETDLFDDEDKLQHITKRLGTYAIVTTPIWRDSFKRSSLAGLSKPLDPNIRWRNPGLIKLNTSATSGTVTSIPITAGVNAVTWDTFHFSATTSSETGILFNLLDQHNTIVWANIPNGADLSSLSVQMYPSLKLQAILTATVAGESPELHEWRLGWVVQEPPHLSIGKTAPAVVSVGELITYTLMVTNTGVGTATNLLLADTLPLGAYYVDSDEGGTLLEQTVHFTLPLLEPNAFVTRTFWVTATEAVTNSAYQVSADGGFQATGTPVVTMVEPRQFRQYLPLLLKE